MIKINISEKTRLKISDDYWEWFKMNKLKSLISNIAKKTMLQEHFFESQKNFEKWYDNKGNKQIKKWIDKQDDTKFNILKKFIIGDKKELETIKERIGKIEGEDKEQYKFYLNMYTDFRKSYAGKLVKILHTPVCPYCNRNFTDSYIKKDNEYRFNGQLDHFFYQENYPYLAMSLFNLIPSCPRCNLMKSSTDEDIIYPYDEIDGDFGKDAVFKTYFYTDEDKKNMLTSEEITSSERFDVSYLFGNSDNFNIKLEIRTKESEKVEKIKKSIKIFELNEVYALHKDYVIEIIKKAIVYNESMIEELFSSYPDLFSKESEVFDMIFSNTLENSRLGERPLSKLTNDIVDELGIRRP